MSAPLPDVKGGINSVDIAGREATLVFLLYLNRSGSTYLASRLAEREGVVVTLESEAIGQLLLSSRPVFSREQREGCLQQLLAEPKFMQWGIDPGSLRRAVAEAPLPLARERLLRIVLSLLPGGDSARCFIIKSPRMLERLPGAVGMLRNCKLVHICRDPRAVYASQRAAISSRTGEPMVRDAVTAGLRWRHAMRLVSQCELPGLIELRYEDLVTRFGETLQRLDQHLGLETAGGDEKGGGNDYLERIHSSQRHLHDNVARPPDASRIDAWQEQLTPGEVWLLERACGRELKRHRYASQAELGRSPGVLCIAGAGMKHARYFLRDVYRRLWRRFGS